MNRTDAINTLTQFGTAMANNRHVFSHKVTFWESATGQLGARAVTKFGFTVDVAIDLKKAHRGFEVAMWLTSNGEWAGDLLGKDRTTGVAHVSDSHSLNLLIDAAVVKMTRPL